MRWLMLLLALLVPSSDARIRVKRGPIAAAAGGGTPTVCGNNAASTGGNGGNSGVAVMAGACIPAANATVVSCAATLQDGDAGNHIQCAVYGGTSSEPTGSPLCTSASTVAVNGLNTLTLSGCGTLTAGSTYYIGFNMDAGGDYLVSATTPALHGPYQLSSYGSWPTGGTWSNDDGAGGVRYAIFYLNTLQ